MPPPLSAEASAEIRAVRATRLNLLLGSVEPDMDHNGLVKTGYMSQGHKADHAWAYVTYRETSIGGDDCLVDRYIGRPLTLGLISRQRLGFGGGVALVSLRVRVEQQGLRLRTTLHL